MMKNLGKMEKLLQSHMTRISVPAGINHKIMRRVARESARREERRILISSFCLLFAFVVGIYGFTGFVVNSIHSEFLLYVSTLLSDPGLLFDGEGFRAFLERLPLISLLSIILAFGLGIHFSREWLRIKVHVYG